jgi:hypothetical protein
MAMQEMSRGQWLNTSSLQHITQAHDTTSAVMAVSITALAAMTFIILMNTLEMMV